jgi:hypothetical protein
MTLEVKTTTKDLCSFVEVTMRTREVVTVEDV